MLRSALSSFALIAACLPAMAQEADPAPAVTPVAATQESINTAIRRGVDYLLGCQELDGSWRYHMGAYPSGQTALSAYTLLKCGLRPEHPALLRALEFLRTHPPRKTYSVACTLMALEATGAADQRGRIAALCEQLLDWQTGGWAYPGGAVDLSNTQYAALGLRAAAKAGVEVPDKAWQRLLDYALSCELDETGGFGYHPRVDPTGSMTSAGLTATLIARDALLETKKLRPREAAAVERTVKRALDWLARELIVDQNPVPTGDHEGWKKLYHHYYLYGLERVGALAGVDSIGPHDWYALGARYLVDHQGGEGQWASPYGEPQNNTCFALLFLRRATRPTTGGEPVGRKVYGADDPTQAISLRAAGDTPLTLWVSSWGAETIDRYEWFEDEGRGPRVAHVEYLVGEELLARASGDSARAAVDQRFAAQVRFKEPGEYRVRVRAYLVPPGLGAAEAEAVDSPPLEVRIDEVLAHWMLPAASAAERNLLLTVPAEVRASSHKGAGWAPALALDGLLAQGWLAEPEDDEPWLRIDLEKPVKADVLYLTHAQIEPPGGLRLGRASRVGVALNKRRPFEVSLDPTDLRRLRIPLEKAERLRRIELFVLERAPGDRGDRSVGFMEVEAALEGGRR